MKKNAVSYNSYKELTTRTIFRKAHNNENPYALISKRFLRDTRLSMKAKGLMCYLLSLPDDWRLSIKEVISNFSDGEKSVRSGVRELIGFNYIEKVQERCNKGYFSSTIYLVHEEPIRACDASLEPPKVYPYAQNRNADERHLLSTDSTNIKINNNSYLSTIKDKLEVRNQSSNKDKEAVVVSEIRKLNPDLKVSDNQLKKWILKYGETYVTNKLAMMLKAKPDRPERYLNSAIKFDWLPSKPKVPKVPEESANMSKVFPSHTDNVAWFDSLSEPEKKMAYDDAVLRWPMIQVHLKQQNVRVRDNNFTSHSLFKVFMSVLGRAE